ncbi:MAG TPA: imidazole glycerol phosphate synthase subunit HisH [Candidatus Dormibacteraeota bacterium]|nr:imidazole glycerol phosphate synthase subunit HisH [Candidatus Dormibacteraeota bacterium]
MKLTLLDHGAGNVASVERALQRLGVESQRATTPEGVEHAEAIVLPGVGHYNALIRALDQRLLRDPLLHAIGRGVPFLGICLGLQALYEASEEAPELTGLRLLPGRVRSLPPGVKLPHMGWNQLCAKSESRLLEGISPDAYVYFAHSYAATAPGVEVVATCKHGIEFVAVVEKGNMCAVQFHPEKSGEAGSRVLQNYLRLCA